MATSNYTNKCVEFSGCFKWMQGVTTLQSENVEYNDFSGTVYINRLEFVCIDKCEGGEYMVYINNPYCEVNEDGCAIFTEEHPRQQWIFGYYKSFKRALSKARAIVKKRSYPKPIEIW